MATIYVNARNAKNTFMDTKDDHFVKNVVLKFRNMRTCNNCRHRRIIRLDTKSNITKHLFCMNHFVYIKDDVIYTWCDFYNPPKRTFLDKLLGRNKHPERTNTSYKECIDKLLKK